MPYLNRIGLVTVAAATLLGGVPLVLADPAGAEQQRLRILNHRQLEELKRRQQYYESTLKPLSPVERSALRQRMERQRSEQAELQRRQRNEQRILRQRLRRNPTEAGVGGKDTRLHRYRRQQQQQQLNLNLQRRSWPYSRRWQSR